MDTGRIDEKAFAELLSTQFPHLKSDVDEWSGLLHLQTMELVVAAQKAADAGRWTEVGAYLRFVDQMFAEGTSSVRNAICVTFLENLPRAGVLHDEFAQRMSVRLRVAWSELLDCLSQLKARD